MKQKGDTVYTREGRKSLGPAHIYRRYMPGVTFVGEGVVYPGDPYSFDLTPDRHLHVYILLAALPLLVARFCVLCVRLSRSR